LSILNTLQKEQIVMKMKFEDHLDHNNIL
jgi:hypothetical protein